MCLLGCFLVRTRACPNLYPFLGGWFLPLLPQLAGRSQSLQEPCLRHRLFGVFRCNSRPFYAPFIAGSTPFSLLDHPTGNHRDVLLRRFPYSGHSILPHTYTRHHLRLECPLPPRALLLVCVLFHLCVVPGVVAVPFSLYHRDSSAVSLVNSGNWVQGRFLSRGLHRGSSLPLVRCAKVVHSLLVPNAVRYTARLHGALHK